MIKEFNVSNFRGRILVRTNLVCWLFLFFVFVLWGINLRRLFNAKAVLIQKQLCKYLAHRLNKKVHIFPYTVCPKVIIKQATFL